MAAMLRFSSFLIVVCCSFLTSSCGSKSIDPAPKSGSSTGPMVVDGIIVQPGVLENIVRSSGRVLSSESVELVTEAAGRIDAISFKEGAYVRKNDLLVKINDDDLQAQLRKVELQIALASEQEKRQEHLFKSEGISREQYDIALNQVNVLKADRDNLSVSIRKREVRAPFDGFIGLRYVSEGGYVSQTTRIASIQKTDPVKVDFAIPEKYAGKVAVGDIVDFSNDETALHYTGRLYAIEPKIDPTMGTLQLRAICDNKAGRIFPGAYVQIELRLKEITDALMVPTQAIIPVLKGQTVLVRKNGVVASIPVRTGIRTATRVQIVNGLVAGDTIITTGIMQLRPGMPVNVTLK
jgi:membrane fusion protein (multidrug efflux system)